MKAILNRLELLSLAKAADSIAPNLAAMDALKGVLLEADDDGKVTVAATNLEVALERRMNAEILQPGQLVLNARLFADMLELLGGETVTISGEDGKRVEITSESAGYSIPALPAKSFPRMEIPFPEDTVPVTGIPAMARRTVFAVSENEAQPLMRCVNLIFTSEGLRAVGCDGSRLAAAKGDSKSEGSVSMLIPAASLGKLAHLIGNKDELYVGTTGKTVVFTKEDFVFSARLMEGNFIDADRMLASVKSGFTILTDAAALWEAVSSVTVVAGESNSFSLRFQEGRLTIRCESENGSSSREMDVVPLAGTPSGEYWYNHRQLSDCLKALNGTLMLEVGQNGILLMRTDDLVCLQMSKRKPPFTHGLRTRALRIIKAKSSIIIDRNNWRYLWLINVVLMEKVAFGSSLTEHGFIKLQLAGRLMGRLRGSHLRAVQKPSANSVKKNGKRSKRP